ncbi:PREDICTED: CASP-like protein 4B1 [Tarenaya hassleriana]|uniref:CASP-like protein 4B1 n=1 Tax=Tarenaya hassleriana TaxID=28532 RepID=UPI00053C1DCB|nr:PREDICTED: CASP-like protein 4B1 [Tarenaya hassleriana]
MTNGENTSGGAVSTPSKWWGLKEITVKFKRKDLIEKASLILRGFALLFSVISFLVMLLNKHGPRLHFSDYDVYKFLFAAVAISGLYNAGYVVLTVFGKIYSKTMTLAGSIGDQLPASDDELAGNGASVSVGSFFSDPIDDVAQRKP